MKKGFTLIELLAVIVILAIIALIATPIILGIINDARKESQERSIELYAAAAKNAIAKHQLNNTSAPTSFDQLNIEYDGDVVCTTKELYEDGSIYLADCTVNGTAVEYTYGEKQELPSTQAYKPQYYSWSSGSVGGDLPSDAKPTVAELNPSYPFYLGLDVEDGKVSAAYSCFVRNNTEYCLKGYDTEVFATNTEIIKDAYADVVDTDACSFGVDSSSCRADGLHAYAESYGTVYPSADNAGCRVHDDGSFVCYEE